MKVIHVETGMHLYGGALQVFFLLRGLKAHPGEHILVCPPGSAIADAAREFARVVEIPCKGDHDLAFLWRLKRLLQRERPDLVHLHSRRGADILGGIAAKLAGVPAILSRRVDNPEPRWLVALKYRLYTRVITISDGIRRVLLQEGLPPQKVTCVRSAVDTDKFRPGCVDHAWFRQQFNLPDNERTIAMLAQFIPRKGHQILLDALPAVLDAHPNTRILLFGQGPAEYDIRQIALQRELGNHVVFAGFRNDLHRLLPCIDVVAHPAYMEGLGISLLQSAACGVPIVASAVGGIPEILHDPSLGHLIPPGNSDALASALIDVLDKQSRQHHDPQVSHRLISDSFSISAMVDGNISVYHSITHGNHPA